MAGADIKHYWGLDEIGKRIGVSSRSAARKAIFDYGLPVHYRPNPRTRVKAYYASEAMILAWELSRARETRKVRVGQIEAKRSARKLRQSGGTHSADEQG